MPGSTLLTRTATIAALTIALTGLPVWAAGGGGGGGGSMPSESTPQFDPAVEYRTGVTALQAQRWVEAERAFRNVLSVAPRDANSNYLMGLTKIGKGDYKGAKGFLEKAVRFGPDNIGAHHQLGVTQARLGDPAKAGAELAWLQAKSASCGATCSDSAALQQAIRAIEAAIAAGRQASLIVPRLDRFASADSGDDAYLAAVSLINEHRYDDAITSLRAASEVFGPHPDVLTYLGFANRKLGRYDLAEAYYLEALAVAPNHRGATEYYGEMMLERGNVAGATRMLARLDRQCTFGCAEADELRRWIVRRSSES
ncbi:MAG TPA: tetratricopeptide repeat protein [Novosphingobium sp.]|nr:tetratricopeptide repeat protein [Novosphingobium sp.]